MVQYNGIVGLGGKCVLAHQIRRHFNVSAAHVFDWWVTPTPALIDLLENNFSGLFEPENMTPCEGGKSTVCSFTGILHPHDFEQSPESSLVFREKVSEKCRVNKEKYAALANRFRQLKGRILFIRYGDGTHNATSHFSPYSASTINRLVKALELRAPDANFDLLLVLGDESKKPIEASGFDKEIDPRVRFDFDMVDNDGAMDWKGNDESWSSMFRRHAEF